ncbi:MAG: methyltransferase domain-containing protein [Blastocatellia bacterium]|nr:methyltransferase domain-containing protein [Blastocatellia bacterium]
MRICLAIASGRTLEVAAGGGGLTAAMAGAGRDVVVNDLLVETLSASLALFDIDRRRLTVLGGNVFDLEPEKLGTFDLVIASEVIEHVAHPDQFLAHLARFLEPQGRIVVTTPNGSFFRNPLPDVPSGRRSQCSRVRAVQARRRWTPLPAHSERARGTCHRSRARG